MEPHVQRTGGIPEIERDERCLVAEWWNSPDDEDLSIARARVPPGLTTRWHVLAGIAERYVVIGGEGLVEIGFAPGVHVRPFDDVFIPPGVRQRITNTGEGDLLFLALCTPRFDEAAYRDLDGDVS